MRCVVLSAVLVGGCGLLGSKVEGKWEGDCSVSTGSYTLDLLVELDIEEAKGGDLEGEADIGFEGYSSSLDGDVEGSLDGKKVEFDVEVHGDGYTWAIAMEGEVDGDEMDGDCEVDVQGYHFTGDFELDRKD